MNLTPSPQNKTGGVWGDICTVSHNLSTCDSHENSPKSKEWQRSTVIFTVKGKNESFSSAEPMRKKTRGLMFKSENCTF